MGSDDLKQNYLGLKHSKEVRINTWMEWSLLFCAYVCTCEHSGVRRFMCMRLGCKLGGCWCCVRQALCAFIVMTGSDEPRDPIQGRLAGPLVSENPPAFAPPARGLQVCASMPDLIIIFQHSFLGMNTGPHVFFKANTLSTSQLQSPLNYCFFRVPSVFHTAKMVTVCNWSHNCTNRIKKLSFGGILVSTEHPSFHRTLFFTVII